MNMNMSTSISTIELLKKLCNSFGPTGAEEGVAALIKEEIADICPEARCDKMGNLIAVMGFGDVNASDRKRIMVSAHMDEVGFMITEIRSSGYLGIDTVGGINSAVLAGRKVTVRTKDGELIAGVIPSKAIHHKDKDDRLKPLSAEKLYIDIGAKDDEEAARYVRIGDFATFDSEFYTFGENGGMLKAKAIDDRMGCAALIETMRALKKNPPVGNIDACFCFTVREEIGRSGAKAAAYALRPHLSLVLETTAVADIADVEPARRVADVGEGVVISVMDRSTIYNKDTVRAAFEIAKKTGVKAQVKRYVSGGNDAGTIHRVAEGINVLAMSVPTRYLHSAACVASLEDYEAQKRLTEEIIRNYTSII